MRDRLSSALQKDAREDRLSTWVQESLEHLRNTIVEMDTELRDATEHDPGDRIQIIGGQVPLSLPDNTILEIAIGEDRNHRVTIQLMNGGTAGLVLATTQNKSLTVTPMARHILAVSPVPMERL